MKCSKCGFNNESGSTFCRECGARLVNSVNCPKCNAEVPVGQKFCCDCGYKFASVSDYPKSKALTKDGGIQSKMVCSCGSKDFCCDKIAVGGYNEGEYARVEIFKYNYVCEKCGAKVYHSYDDSGDFFVFVPKDKAKEARALSDSIGVTEKKSFGRDFCISSRWDDFLANVNFDFIYHYLNHVLDRPTQIIAGYVNKVFDNTSMENIVALETWKNREFGEEKSGNGQVMSSMQKEGKTYAFDFGPASSFAIDLHGKLVLNSDPNYKVASDCMPADFWAPSKKYNNVLKTYYAIQDEYISVTPIEVDKAEKVLKKLENPIDFYRVNAMIENTFLGGDLVVIANRLLWYKSKMSSVQKVNLGKLKSTDLKHEKGSMDISLGNDKIHLKGPSAEAVDRLFSALKLHMEFLNGIYD